MFKVGRDPYLVLLKFTFYVDSCKAYMLNGVNVLGVGHILYKTLQPAYLHPKKRTVLFFKKVKLSLSLAGERVEYLTI